ncbi:MAG TPA: DMT family transporter [Nitrospirota bacterium]|nr:DMT family transporter [Nitrospirota bacterium]
MTWLLLIAALMMGSVLPLQAGINAQLRSYVGNTAIAACISFIVGTIFLFASTVILRVPWPAFSSLGQAPWWAWTGGLLGAVFVFLAIVLADALGAAVMVGFIITGQMITSLILDHYGLVGYARQPINAPRIIGAVLLLAGVFLIRYKGGS